MKLQQLRTSDEASQPVMIQPSSGGHVCQRRPERHLAAVATLAKIADATPEILQGVLQG